MLKLQPLIRIPFRKISCSGAMGYCGWMGMLTLERYSQSESSIGGPHGFVSSVSAHLGECFYFSKSRCSLRW